MEEQDIFVTILDGPSGPQGPQGIAGVGSQGAQGAQGATGAGLETGWVSDGTTWTRTGNFTFTITGDVTAVYTKGTKVRYKDGGAYEYGVVISSSYGAPNTTVTLATNNDYAMAAATITDNYYSYSNTAQGFPDLFTFTPAYTNYTPGSGANNGIFSISGRKVFVDVNATYGTGSSMGSTPKLTLPVAKSSSLNASIPIGIARIYDNGTALFLGQLLADGSITVGGAAGSYVNEAFLSATVPMTWTTGDSFYLHAVYQI